ncbi:MAG: class I mannose-6-phosphate isomerase [Solirubrobacteraceae bacterium]
MKPQVLPPNVLRHFYAGGARLADLRGLELESDHMPEEWLGAGNTAFGHAERGLSRLEDGTLVRDAIAGDPEAYLGADHVRRYGADPTLLVKLLDAGQRLPVHFHPDRAFAREALGSPYGKTEAWLIVEAEPGAAVWAGFRREVELAEVRGWMREQDSAAMLDALHELPVSAGDAIFIPAGMPHAIGAGILIVELQEPTDLSVLLEWDGFELTEAEGHLELGWDRALEALDRTAVEPPGHKLPEAADPFFRAEWLTGGAPLDRGFSILVGTAGSGTLATEGGGELPFARGSVVLVPHAAGAGELRGEVAAIRSRPSDPGA